MRALRITGTVFLAVIIFGAGIYSGIFIDRQNTNILIVSHDSKADFQLINQAWDLIQNNYVDQAAAKPQNLTYGAIGGMVDSLGDTGHSTFLTPVEVQQENDAEQGQLQGIGVEVQEKDGNVVVIAPIEGSPAQKAGLQSGDIILQVDGQPITDAIDAVTRIRGLAGTSVTLTILESSGVTRTVTLVRAKINLINVTWNKLPGTSIVHLRLASFASNVTGELDTALAAIKSQGASGIILDLRDNPGGLLDQAVGVTSRFIKSGNVLLEKDIHGKITSVPVISGVTVTDLPLVVLVNEGTASAAEIVAGALQDAGRAEIVGETTFGTGTVLTQFPLSDGSAVVLAIQEWLTPSGKTIWHKGLTPDKVVSLATSVTPLSPEAEQGLSQAQIQSSGDQQLLDAINLFP
ncbi:MAG: S41 family peptidase [Chloroflexi bacterium]|nr:S41 family peptidase [Chloroflexota bacterium]